MHVHVNQITDTIATRGLVFQVCGILVFLIINITIYIDQHSCTTVPLNHVNSLIGSYTMYASRKRRHLAAL